MEFLPARGHVASCDSASVHVWDPFIGAAVHQFPQEEMPGPITCATVLNGEQRETVLKETKEKSQIPYSAFSISHYISHTFALNFVNWHLAVKICITHSLLSSVISSQLIVSWPCRRGLWWELPTHSHRQRQHVALAGLEDGTGGRGFTGLRGGGWTGQNGLRLGRKWAYGHRRSCLRLSFTGELMTWTIRQILKI